MLKILKYSFFDLMRSRWSYVYFFFYLALGFVLLFLNNDLSKAVITLMFIIVMLTPLIGTVFGVMYYYNSREFTQLLLAQPLKRSTIFFGQYLGLSASLSLSLIGGLGIPFLLYDITRSGAIWDLVALLSTGVFLTFIFVALAYNIALINENKIKGFGYAILVWLTLAIVYDGVFMALIMEFREYPLDQFALIGTILNPVDLSRIFIILKVDESDLLSITGAMLNNYLGAAKGMFLTNIVLLIWVIVPVASILRLVNKKDF